MKDDSRGFASTVRQMRDDCVVGDGVFWGAALATACALVALSVATTYGSGSPPWGAATCLLAGVAIFAARRRRSWRAANVCLTAVATVGIVALQGPFLGKASAPFYLCVSLAMAGVFWFMSFRMCSALRAEMPKRAHLLDEAFSALVLRARHP